MSYLQPLILLCLAVSAAGWLRLESSKGKALVAAGLAGLFLISWPPAEWLFSRPLEWAVPARAALAPPPQAIVVLGGGISPPEYERPYPLADRDTVTVFGYNSRLDTIQAVVGNWLIPKTESIAAQRIANARTYDEAFAKIKQIRVPVRPPDMRIVYHLYIVFAQRRDALLKHCIDRGIEAKVHYPVPIYRQPALKALGYKEGDFPVSDRHTHEIITFPCDQHLSPEEINFVIDTVREFYEKG